MSKVIHPKFLPSRLPVSLTISTLVALDYWNVPDVFCGMAYFLLAVLWILQIYSINEKEFTQIKDLVFDNPPTPPLKKSGFQSKLEDALKAQQELNQNKN